MSHYVIHGGVAGSNRMHVVARACWPTTSTLLQRAGLQEGMNCLDLGCGAGEVTFEIARLMGPAGRVLGMDMDTVKLDIARQRAKKEGVKNIEFKQANVFEWTEESLYDFIYVRFLLTHLPERERVIPKIVRALRPAGSLALEDIEFSGYIVHPPNPAHDRYVNLYREVVRRRGGDAEIGPRLLAMFAAAGLQEIGLAIVYPEHKEGSGKEISVLTMIGISGAVLEEKLIEESELREVVSELERFTRDPLSVISGPRVFQISGRRATA
jgi:2-polyprenyl-3-methyl-5-hydroxy-6-metoxy-1,4-benzoquinol methylase